MADDFALAREVIAERRHTFGLCLALAVSGRDLREACLRRAAVYSMPRGSLRFARWRQTGHGLSVWDKTRLTLAIGLYATVAFSPWVTLIGLVCTVYWLAVGGQAIFSLLARCVG